MESTKVYRLTQEIQFKSPRAWSVQARYAFVYNDGKPFAAQAGCLAIYLGPRDFFDGQETRVEHLYRFSDGRVGVLDTSPDERFAPVDDPEVVALASLVKTLPEMVAEKGLTFDAISRIDPFTLIRCPMCGGTAFTTLDFAGVWCDGCNTRFETRMTAGDPGVVVDACLAYYSHAHARIVAPHSLMLTLVLKDFGYSSHPAGPCGEYCVNGTTYAERAQQMNYYVSDPTSLRDNTNWCGLEVYDWSLYGKPERRDGHWLLRQFVVDGEGLDGVEQTLYDRPSVRSERLPPLELLAEDEKWCLVDCLSRSSKDRYPWYPVWWKVVADEVTEGGWGHSVWRVVDRTLCPVCLKPAGDDHNSDWCAKWWAEMDWRPGWEPDAGTGV